MREHLFLYPPHSPLRSLLLVVLAGSMLACGAPGGAGSTAAPSNPAPQPDASAAETPPLARNANLADGACVTDLDCPGTACVMVDGFSARCSNSRADVFGPGGKPVPPRGLIDGTALRGTSPQ